MAQRRALRIAAAIPLVLSACSTSSPPPTACLGSLTASPSAAAAGAVVTMTLAYANPDSDNATAVVVDWSVTGGGTLDHATTTLTLTTASDPYGNPAGVQGTVTNAFRATGPTGHYVVHASVEQGAGCTGAAFDAPVDVSGSLPDAGADAGADAASDAPADSADDADAG